MSRCPRCYACENMWIVKNCPRCNYPKEDIRKPDEIVIDDNFIEDYYNPKEDEDE